MKKKLQHRNKMKERGGKRGRRESNFSPFLKQLEEEVSFKKTKFAFILTKNVNLRKREENELRLLKIEFKDRFNFKPIA